jgi:3alpha(or 20beta)-hydroxysteroid dehydrogenase
MALELADKGIRVNSICPGAVDTPMLREGLKRKADTESALGKLINAAPLKKIGIPEDVAQFALFLANNNLSGNITGQEFACDSGILARLASE